MPKKTKTRKPAPRIEVRESRVHGRGVYATKPIPKGARIIEYTSQKVALRPGDLILTGSPAGNGAAWGVFLQDGDVIESEITGLGKQRNRCVDETP